MNISKSIGTASLILAVAACTKDDAAVTYPENILPDSSWPKPPVVEPMNIAGPWYGRIKNNAVNCGAGEYVDAKSILITQEEIDVTLLTSRGDLFAGTIRGDIMEWTGSYPERSGMTDYTSATLVFSVDSGSGNAMWTWTDGVDSCNGTMAISFTRIAVEEIDGNSRPESATQIDFVDNVSFVHGDIGFGNDTSDYFSFMPDADSRLEIELSHFDTSATNLILDLFDEELKRISRSDEADRFEKISADVLAGMRYYIRVKIISGSEPDAYELAIDIN